MATPYEKLTEIQTVGNGVPTRRERNLMLNYLSYIRLTELTPQPVVYNVAQKYRGDIYGLFHELAIPESMWFITMVLNNYRSPYDFIGEAFTLYTPEEEIIENLLTHSPEDIYVNPLDVFYKRDVFKLYRVNEN